MKPLTASGFGVASLQGEKRGQLCSALGIANASTVALVGNGPLSQANRDIIALVDLVVCTPINYVLLTCPCSLHSPIHPTVLPCTLHLGTLAQHVQLSVISVIAGYRF